MATYVGNNFLSCYIAWNSYRILRSCHNYEFHIGIALIWTSTLMLIAALEFTIGAYRGNH